MIYQKVQTLVVTMTMVGVWSNLFLNFSNYKNEKPTLYSDKRR